MYLSVAACFASLASIPKMEYPHQPTIPVNLKIIEIETIDFHSTAFYADPCFWTSG